MTNQTHILAEIQAERARQDTKWEPQNHSVIEWCAILGEEVGEANKHALQAHFSKDVDYALAQLQAYRAELIQIAAVAVAMVESLDRNELSIKMP